jgi:aminopeptidase N
MHLLKQTLDSLLKKHTMRIFLISLLLVCTIFLQAQQIISGGPLKPEQANMDIRHYTLSLEVDPAGKSIKGYTEISLILIKEANTILLDLVEQMKVEKIILDGKQVEFIHENGLITISGSNQFSAGKHLVKVIYAGEPPVAKRAPWEGGFQWEKDSTGNPWVAITCQSEGGKIYFPCKDHPSDEPNEGADLFITVPKGLVVAGPGLLQKVTTKKSQSTYHWKTNYTISNYAILFNVGKYKVIRREYITANNNRVPMEFYVLEEHADKGMHLLEIMEHSARVQEKYFGEYPWVKEKIAIAETPHLGMEHQTMNAYGNKFRYTLVGGMDFDWLLHHEFGHEWWGNKVTNRDWAHMWIQEGICVFGDALYIRDAEGEEAYLERMRRTARATQNKKPIVQGEQIDAKQTYQPDIYGKGAFFMHTLRYIMGDSLFFPTLKKLATAPQYTYDNTVTTDDVEKLFSGAYGQSMKPVFDLFMRTTEKLEVQIRQTDTEKYFIRLANSGMTLPVDIATERGMERVMVGEKGIEVNSKTVPLVDPKGYYLKKVTIE